MLTQTAIWIVEFRHPYFGWLDVHSSKAYQVRVRQH